MEWIQRLLESGTTPIVTAFLLGLLTAISPCPLATNIAAVGFIGKDIDDKHRVFCNGLLYTAGRILTYAGIGLAFIPLLREGANTYALQKIIGKYGDAIVAPALILIGLFMLFGHRLNLPKFGFSGHCEKIGRHGSWGALLLGILFSLAFCPSSGVFYFGMLIPMAASQQRPNRAAGFCLSYLLLRPVCRWSSQPGYWLTARQEWASSTDECR